MSQTRRKGIEILRDEISDISRVVNTHSENITRRLERVKDMVAKYCAGKGDTVAPASSAPSASPASTSTSASSASASQPFSLSEQSPIPTPTVLGSRLNTIPEETNANLSEEITPLANARTAVTKLRSKGPVSWDSFRSKVGEGTNLKTGKGNTLRQISSLWTQAKNGKSASEIEKYLKNELRIEPSLAAAKAPELEAIARNVIQKKGAIQKKGTTRKSLAVAAPNAGAAASNAAVSSKKVTRRKKVSTAAAAAPVPASESNDEFWSRMNKEATANNKRKTEAALALPAASQRVRNEAAAMARAQALKATPLTNKVSQTPFKSRPGVQIPTLVPSRSTTTVINPSTGEEEELSL